MVPQIPNDGPSGKLLSLLDRHEWRPAHIHIIVSKTLMLNHRLSAYDRELTKYSLLLGSRRGLQGAHNTDLR
jgi:hypothetical protein